MVDTIFICKANVGRSQIAEAIYNSMHKNKAISIAGSEARKEKYGGKPSNGVQALLSEKGIDILEQKITYIRDIDLDILKGIKRIVFLYNPIAEVYIDEDCKIDGESVYEYLNKTFGDKIIIFEIQDPYSLGEEELNNIFYDIDNIIKKF